MPERTVVQRLVAGLSSSLLLVVHNIWLLFILLPPPSYLALGKRSILAHVAVSES